MSKCKIDIIMDKPEISTDFKIVCWSEEFEGKKKDAIKRAKSLQKEWTAEFFKITKLNCTNTSRKCRLAT